MRIKAAVLASDGKQIEVSTKGLLDPGRFAKRRAKQAEFENRIAEEFGQPRKEKVSQRPVFDWKTFEVVRQTRFFGGDEPSRYGRKVVIPTFGDDLRSLFDEDLGGSSAA
jgi:hypothetical protein